MNYEASYVKHSLIILALFVATQSGCCTTQLGFQDKVSVGFYEESLCPYCAEFTIKVAAPLFKNGLSDFIRFDLVPYGNAKNTTEGLVCQHGEAECRLNRVFACAIDQAKPQEQWFPFIACVEENFGPDIEDSVQGCADEAGLSYDGISNCATGDKGDALERAAADATDALVPKHQYVPWVTVNGVPLMDDYANLQTYICVALHENSRPDVCLESVPNRFIGYSWHSSGFLRQAASMLQSVFDSRYSN